MGSVNRVYTARLSRMLVSGPLGESFGRVCDVVISISIVRQQPRVQGLVVNLATRRSIFIPMLRVAAIEPDAGLDGQQGRRSRPPAAGTAWTRACRGLAERAGLDPVGAGVAGPESDPTAGQFEGRRAVDVADAIRGLPPKRRYEVLKALDDDRLGDVLQELPELDQADVLSQLGTDRSADVPEEMDPDDAADLLGVLNPTDAEMLLTRMDPDESAPVRRLLTHSPDTAGGLMTSDPVVPTPDTAGAETLARVRDPELTTALSSMVFVARPPSATPTGRYLAAFPCSDCSATHRLHWSEESSTATC